MMIGLYTLAAIQMYNAMQSIRKYGRLHLLLCSYVEYILLEHIITRNSVFLYVSFHSLMLFRTYHHMHQNYHIYYENYF